VAGDEADITSTSITTAYTITLAGINPASGNLAQVVLSDSHATLLGSGPATLNIISAGTGGITMSAGTITIGSGTNKPENFNMETLAVTGGALNIGAGAGTGIGAFNVSGTTVSLTGALVNLTSVGEININGTISSPSSGGGIINVVGSSGTLSLGAGVVISGNTGVVNAGTVTGVGKIGGAFSGSGKVLATGGTLEISSAQSNASPVWQIASASVLRFDANASNDTVTFNSTADGDLALNGGAITFTDTISGMNVGASATAPTNFIDILGTAGVTITGGGTVTGGATTDSITLSTGQILTLSGVVTNGNSTWYAIAKSDGSGGTEIFLNSVICYAEGTAILTDRGEVAVESLQAGDRVITLQDGQPVPMAIKWTGNRHIDLLAHPRPYTAAPVRIRAGAFGDDLPRRDLLVSPAHAIYVDGKLVPANLLINHMTIVQDMDAASVSYHHIELERHALILAEGLTSESYLDTGNRAYFDNAGLAYVAHPEFHVNAGLKTWEEDACAPLAIDAETVAPIWHDLAARAEALGYSRPALATTADADIFLEANGRRLRPVASADGRYSFMLPAGTKALTLRSRATAPADLNPLSGDWRPLGVAVRGMTLRAGDDHIVIPADHPGLTQGWHTAEKAGDSLWRWTSGAAQLPLPAIAAPMMLDIDIANTATYVLAEATAEQRLAA
jgi:hypothetical protein